MRHDRKPAPTSRLSPLRTGAPPVSPPEARLGAGPVVVAFFSKMKTRPPQLPDALPPPRSSQRFCSRRTSRRRFKVLHVLVPQFESMLLHCRVRTYRQPCSCRFLFRYGQVRHFGPAVVAVHQARSRFPHPQRSAVFAILQLHPHFDLLVLRIAFHRASPGTGIRIAALSLPSAESCSPPC